MKNLLVAAFALSTLLASGAAFGQTQTTAREVVETTTLKTVSIDPGLSEFASVKIADLEINDTEQTITLTLVFPSPCGPVQPHVPVCTRPQRAPVTIKLPIVPTREASICGIRTLVGAVDRRPVDGDLTSIRVTDYSHFSCESKVGFAQDELTTVTLEFEGVSRMSGQFDEKMTFKGPKLETLFDGLTYAAAN